MPNTVKYVIVSKGPLTIAEAEELRPEAIKAAKESPHVPVLVTCGDAQEDPITVGDMERIKGMIDSEIAWVRIGSRIANLIIAEAD